MMELIPKSETVQMSHFEWAELRFWNKVLYKKPGELRTFFLMRAIGSSKQELLQYAEEHFSDISPVWYS